MHDIIKFEDKVNGSRKDFAKNCLLWRCGRFMTVLIDAMEYPKCGNGFSLISMVIANI
jgi:hypothetical protein